MKKVKIACLGLGVIGSKLVHMLLERKEWLEKEYQMELVIEKIYVSNLNKKRDDFVKTEWLTTDAYDAIDQSDLVLECIGGNGCEMTRELVLYALQKGKQVVMSSKKCLAKYGEELCMAAKKAGVMLRYDASVGGGIPISTVLERMGKGEELEEIYGIMNATSNYILTQMSEAGKSYEEALLEAQQMGIAENNPSDDVDGFDCVYKAVILAGFGMNTWIKPDEIKAVPLSEVEMEKRDCMKEGKPEEGLNHGNGLCDKEIMKPVFRIFKDKKDQHVSIEVKPQKIAKEHIMANVRDTNNIIILVGSESGERALIGEGAGAGPSASAMFDDATVIFSKLA